MTTLTEQRTPEEQAGIDAFLSQYKQISAEQGACAQRAVPALARLAEVLKDRGGQSYKIRAILYSLWNGKPAKFDEVLCFDWNIRKDVCDVILGFGYSGGGFEFFYNAIESAVKAAGQWKWFLEERNNVVEE